MRIMAWALKEYIKPKTANSTRLRCCQEICLISYVNTYYSYKQQIQLLEYYYITLSICYEIHRIDRLLQNHSIPRI